MNDLLSGGLTTVRFTREYLNDIVQGEAAPLDGAQFTRDEQAPPIELPRYRVAYEPSGLSYTGPIDDQE